MRSLNLFILASAALHALVLVALPQMNLRAPAEPAPLQVTITAPRPLPMALQIAAVEKPQRRPPEKKVDAPALPPLRMEAAPVLALPRQATAPEPVFSIPTPEPPITVPTPPATAPRDTARAAPKAESDLPEQTSPPVFNAAYLRNPEPRYPVSARRRGEQGTVLLKVMVTREGTAASVSVDKSSGSAALDHAASDTVRTWRFAPARRGSEPIESSVIVPIVFKLEGAS